MGDVSNDEVLATGGSSARSLADRFGDILSVRDYGATGDGVTDDAPFIRDAIAHAESAGGGTIYFPAGTYLCERDGSENYVFVLDGSTDLEFRGDGRGSVIQTGRLSASDLHTFQLQGDAARIVFRDFTGDGRFPPGTSTVGTNEQVHFIRIGTGNSGDLSATDVVIEGVLFQNVRGDGVNIIGVNDTLGTKSSSARVRINNCVFDGCHRSGLGVQRQAVHVQVLGCWFRNTNDQDIDFEPTGSGQDYGFIIANNIFDHTYKSGNLAVTLTGLGASRERHEKSIVAHNILWEGKIQALNVKDLIIEGNIIYVDGSASGEALLHLFRGVDDVAITDNIFIRKYRKTGYTKTNQLDSPGNLLTIKQNNGVRPRGILITCNQFYNEAPTGGIVCTSCDDVIISDNKYAYAYGDTGVRTGIRHDPDNDASDGFLFAGNLIRGDHGIAELRTRTYATGTLTTTANFSNGETVTIAGQTYTFRTVLTPTANEVLIGAYATESILHLGAAISLEGGSGVNYASSTVANANVWADKALSAANLVVVARSAGTAANAFTTTETCASASFGDSTLSGGTQLADNLGCIIRARHAGSAGNSITITTVADGSGAGNWTASGSNLTFHFESGVTTVADFVTKMRSDSHSNELIDVDDDTESLETVGSTPMVAVDDEFGPSSLSGGGGSLKYALNVGSTGAAQDGISILNNQFDGVDSGDYRFTGTFTSYPLVQGNKGTVGYSGLSAAIALIIGGNAANAPQLLCSNSPESQVTAPVGSTCVRVDGGTGTTFYVKESGVGNAGWVAK